MSAELLEQWFAEAIELPAFERHSFVERIRSRDPELFRRLAKMIETHERAERIAFFAPKASLPAVEQPGQRIGPYLLRERLGEGGWGVVFLAEQEEPVRRQVALKVIKAGLDTRNVVARFDAEREALSRMDHPNIARVLDGGSTGPLGAPVASPAASPTCASWPAGTPALPGRPYFVMELVRGVKITDYCEHNHLDLTARLKLFMQVCQAVQHAHQKGIIHRDLKPSNILVTRYDGIPVPKVIDFGIAKAMEGRLTDLTMCTELHHFLGTPAYMSPEQAGMSGADIDTRGDIYSLGVLLYELLTGKPPFDPAQLLAAGLDEMRRTLREKDPVRPSTRLEAMAAGELFTAAQHRRTEAPRLIHAIRGDLDWVVMKCLEKDRTRRYETANGLAADIQRHLLNEPVVARPPSAAYRFQKLLRRNKTAALAGASVILALLCGLAASLWQAVRARHAERSALMAQMRAEASRQNEAAQRERAEQNEKQLARNLYFFTMKAAQQAWSQNNAEQVRAYLEETKNHPERGWEWFYWQKQLHQDLRTLRGHRKPVTISSFSPDGSRIFTAGEDHKAILWNAANGEVIQILSTNGVVSAAAFSRDGRRLAAGMNDGQIQVWDPRTGGLLSQYRAHRTNLMAIQFNPDGDILTAASPEERKIELGVNGTNRLSWLAISDHAAIPGWLLGPVRIERIVFSPDGRMLASLGNNGQLTVWESSGAKKIRDFPKTFKGVLDLRFSADGRTMAIGAAPLSSAFLWDVASGEEKLQLEHKDWVFCVALSQDRTKILTGCQDHNVRLWDAGSGKLLRTFIGHGDRVLSVSFSADETRVLSGSADQSVKIWDINARENPYSIRMEPNRIEASDAPNTVIVSMEWCRDNRRVVTGSFDHTARVYDTRTGRELARFVHSNEVWAVAFAPDGKRIAAGGKDKKVTVWDLRSRARALVLKDHTDEIKGVAFSPDGKLLASASEDGSARVWDAESGAPLVTVPASGGKNLRFSRDGRKLAATSWDSMARVWEVPSGKLLVELKGHANGVRYAAFSPDERRIVTASFDGTAKIWDAQTGACQLTLKGHGRMVPWADFSPDGRRVVTGSFDGTAKIFETETGVEVLTLECDRFQNATSSFSPDGLRIATAGADGIIKIWASATQAEAASWMSE